MKRYLGILIASLFVAAPMLMAQQEPSHMDHVELGAFVVHKLHGVGTYRGLTKLPVGRAASVDFLHLEYDGGALYLHVDWRASAFAKCLLDEVFGPAAFRGWIVWRTGCGAKSRRRWSQEHQDILCYAKGEHMTFRPRSKALRAPFAKTSRAMHFTNVDEGGRKYRSRVVNGKEYVYFEDEGKLVGSVWDDVPAMAAGSPILRESVGYPTQKPEKLLARIGPDARVVRTRAELISL